MPPHASGNRFFVRQVRQLYSPYLYAVAKKKKGTAAEGFPVAGAAAAASTASTHLPRRQCGQRHAGRLLKSQALGYLGQRAFRDAHVLGGRPGDEHVAHAKDSVSRLELGTARTGVREHAYVKPCKQASK